MWRKIRREDVRRGVVVRMSNMKDSPFNGCVIIKVDRAAERAGRVMHPGSTDFVYLARPMAYAHEHWDSRTPMLTAEVIDLDIDRVVGPDTDMEVYEYQTGSFAGKLLTSET